MSKTNSNANRIKQIFENYCKDKNYRVQSSENANNDLRLEISNIRERTIVTIYHTGSIVIGGQKNSLKDEFTDLKQKIETNLKDLLGNKTQTCAAKYNIMSKLRGKVKESLKTLDATIEIIDNPNPDIEYRAKIARNDFSITLTQYNNNTLFLQGKTDKLFDDSCDLIEKIANPSEKEVIDRFILSDEKSLKIFDAKYYTPALIISAEDNVKNKIGFVYEYLEPYDKKWFVASECLCLTKIPLPEFSPLVMPASKAFEGFVKKLLVGIGLVEADHFKTKNANFSALNDENNPKRKSICDKEKHADTMLKKISLCLNTSRNFMMHSDDSKITKVDSQKEAEEKVNSIFKDTKEIFNYFNDLYALLPTQRSAMYIEPENKLLKTYESIKLILKTNDIEVSGYKLIEYGLQFTISVLDWSGIIRIYQNKKGVLKIDYSQLKGEANAIKIQSLIENKIISSDLAKSGNKEVELGFPIIGTDESGKGDYFGPLVSAGVYVDEQSAKDLIECGVKDSKKLSDSKNLELAREIAKICKGSFAIIETSPEKYNNLYEQFKKEKKNLNTLLAWGHAKAIEEILSKVDCKVAIADQFADEGFILGKLQEKGKKLKLIQVHKAEQNIAVAAASIIARARFLEKLSKLSNEYKIDLHKGASQTVIENAKKFVDMYGEEKLRKVAKLHFKTTIAVVNK